MCFRASPKLTAARRKPFKTPGKLRRGFKVVSASRNSTVRCTDFRYPAAGQWVAAQEGAGSFVRQPDEATFGHKMRAGIYLYTTAKAAYRERGFGQQVIELRYDPRDVLGAATGVVCVTRAKVVS
jgi:hypothetical protein